MPIYAYKCESCGFAKDVLQKISDAQLQDCPQCKAAAFKKQVTAAGFQLKGSGWYVTDFKGGSTPASAPAAAANASEGAPDSATAGSAANAGAGASASGSAAAASDGGSSAKSEASPSAAAASASSTPSSSTP